MNFLAWLGIVGAVAAILQLLGYQKKLIRFLWTVEPVSVTLLNLVKSR